ncbi:MAG: glycosyltransferase [Gammaproteobacteria bacterium]
MQELLGLERHGFALQIFSLQRPTERLRHGHVDQLQARVVYLAAGSRVDASALLALGALLLTAPRRLLGSLGFLLRRAEGGRLRDLLMAARVAREARSDAFYAHFASEPAAVAELAAQLRGGRFAISAHAKDIYLADPVVLARKLARASFVCTCTEYNRRYLAARTPAPERIVCVRHGLDANPLLAQPPPAATPGAPPLILAVGRFRPKKGFAVLIDALAALAARGAAFRCLIIGYGPQEQELRDRINAHGLGDRVELRGPMVRTALLELYRRAELFTLPCRVDQDGDRDGIPNVLMEAMAAGLAVVSTPISGIPELVDDGNNGVLVASGDAAALADAIAALLADTSRRRRLGAAARETIRARFTFEQNLAPLVGLLAAHLAPPACLPSTRRAGLSA